MDRERLLLDAEILGRTGAWEMDLLTGDVQATPGTLRLFFGDDPDKGAHFDDYTKALHPDDRESVLAHREKMVAGLAGPETDFRVIWPDGSVHTLGVYQTVIRDATGRAVRTVGMNIDVTERKRAEDALRAMQEQLVSTDRILTIGTMAAGIAHEINNPLAYTQSNIEFALEQLQRCDDPRALATIREALEEARDGTTRVGTIVRDLKTFARPDELTRVAVDVEAILESSLHMVSNAIHTRARVVREYRPLPRVVANEARLGQVFLNLIINAAQAIPEGDPTANELRIATTTDVSGRAEISVRDTGRGMTADVRARIFEPFFTTKPVGEGTGLGLAIARRIVADLGGEIVVASELGRGSEFRVVLPPAPANAIEGSPHAGPRSAPRRASILVIDDEPLIRTSLQRLLHAEHDVTTASSARQALDLLARGERYDVILCDLMMPDMSGVDLHDDVARIDPGLARRIVFFTGGAYTPATREFLSRVPSRVIEKPFRIDELRAAVQEQLERV